MSDDTIRVVELGVDADEEVMGIAEITAIRLHILTIVVVRTTDGFMAYSGFIHPDEVLARARARKSASDNLRRYWDRRKRLEAAWNTPQPVEEAVQ